MSLQAWMASSSAPASLGPPEQPTATRATAAAPAMPDMRRRVRGVRMMGSLHFVVQFGGCGGGSTGCVDAGEPGVHVGVHQRRGRGALTASMFSKLPPRDAAHTTERIRTPTSLYAGLVMWVTARRPPAETAAPRSASTSDRDPLTAPRPHQIIRSIHDQEASRAARRTDRLAGDLRGRRRPRELLGSRPRPASVP